MGLLTTENENGKRRTDAILGLLGLLVSLPILWGGFNSFLVGWAYMGQGQKGAWLALLAGAIVFVLGVWLLFSSVVRSHRGFRSEDALRRGR